MPTITFATEKKEIQVLGATDLELDAQLLDPQNNLLYPVNLSFPPERKKGIILEGEDIAKQLATIIREEEKII